MIGFTTKAVHGLSARKDPHGALRQPVYDTAAFEFSHSRDLELAFEGRKPAHAYSRITNPTVEELEQKIKLLADAFGVIAVSSGMAAISDTVMALAESGSNIITSRHLFGNTLSLFTNTLGRWGLETRFADLTVPETIVDILDEKTRLVFLEVISNPQLEVADIQNVCAVAATRNIPVVLDGTLTTPYLFKSKDAGVAVEIISSTKYISGGATSVGGLIIDNGIFDWSNNAGLADQSRAFGPGAFLVRLRKEVFRNLGACLSPHNAWLQTLGLETLALRIERSCSNAMAVAQFLKDRPHVVSVNYPGLEDSAFHSVAARQFSRGYGGLLTFELADKETCFTFMDTLKVIRKATNLNDNKSLILHPASTIFSDFTLDERQSMQVSEGLIRLSIGIEDTQDIIDDLTQGLDSL